MPFPYNLHTLVFTQIANPMVFRKQLTDFTFTPSHNLESKMGFGALSKYMYLDRYMDANDTPHAPPTSP